MDEIAGLASKELASVRPAIEGEVIQL